jgi:rhodanese-related sulfurtransferase
MISILKKNLLFSIILTATGVSAQYVKTASCADLAFDKKVDGYLSYTSPVISVKDAFRNKSTYIFLDAREMEEYKVSHIPGSRFIGYDDFSIHAINDLSKESKIIVYCSIGYRSEKIATKLKKAGFKKVYNLYGSIFEWVNEGYEITDKSGKSSNKIHTYNKKWSQWVKNPNVEKTW